MPEAVLSPEREKLSTSPEEPKTVLFVCTGNTCRSPMCAALFNALLAEGTGFRAFSRGLSADGAPISQNAVTALIHRGIKPAADNDYIAHVSKTVAEEDLRAAHLVVGLTNRHAMELMFRFPAYATKLHVMPRDITDPYGGDLSVYEACLGEIEAGLREAFVPNGEAPEADGHD